MSKISLVTAAAILTASVLTPLSSHATAAGIPGAAKLKTAASQGTVHTLANLPPVKITAKSVVRLTDVNILTLDHENVLTYTLLVQNNDNKAIDLIDYWSKVKTVSGTIYSTSLISQDKEKKKVAAGSSTTLTFTTRVAKHIQPQHLIFQVIKWDFSQPGYEALKGQFKVPAGYLMSTPSNQSKTLPITDARIKAQVEGVTTYASGDYNYVSLKLALSNQGYRLFEAPDFKFVIRTATGLSYPLTLDPGSVEYKIQPNDKKILHLTAQIPKAVKLSGMGLQIAIEDETAKQSLPIATMQLPNEASQWKAIQPGSETLLQVKNGKLAAQVGQVTITQNDGEHLLSVRVALRNTGATVVDLPEYQFELHTSDGYRLPVNLPALEKLTLQPQEDKYITLSVTIPKNISTVNPRLFMNLPLSEENKENLTYPVAIFALPELHPVENMIGTRQQIQTKNGALGVTLSSVQKLPWGDGQMINAKITIDNPNAKTLQLPDLSGVLQMDSAELTEETKLVLTQPDRLIGAGMSTDIYVVARAPGYLNFNQLQVVLREKLGENSTDWVRFGNTGNIPEITDIPWGASFTFDTLGRKQEISVLNSRIYSSVSSDLLYAEVMVENLEEYSMDLSQFVGAFQTSNGRTYKASVSQTDSQIGPGEKNIVTFWAKVREPVSTSYVKLIIGEGITDNKLTPVKGEAAGYVNGVAMELDIVKPRVKRSLRDLPLSPYELSVRKVDVDLSGLVSFTYDLSHETGYDLGETKHKYLFEIKDSNGWVFNKEFVPGVDLQVMDGGRMSFSLDRALLEDLTEDDDFDLTIYDLFENHKVKLGSRSLYYSDSTDDADSDDTDSDE
ncbi:hypothetical protein [Paenibacillus sanguinis]|uniref:hypothetical protein n=1 Tax=Paenibacillus sanguinis TaxID=225906 RepID=UPI0003824DD3|nr:hypothetical protein [Paenibacillus sanguinis]